MAKRISRPLRWPGGKFYQSVATVAIMPPHDSFMETDAGALHTLLDKPQTGVIERVCDINSELTNFWRVLQDPNLFELFYRRVSLTPLSEIEFQSAMESKAWDGAEKTRVDAAVKFFIRIRQSRTGQGKCYVTPTRRLRRGINEQVSAWLGAVDGLMEVHDRLISVEVITGDAAEQIRKYDDAKALFYSDPPYMHETRVTKGEYGLYEMSDRSHAILLSTYRRSNKKWLTLKQWHGMSGNEPYTAFEAACGHTFQGMFMLCGYRSKLYDHVATQEGWYRSERTITNSASAKSTKAVMTECIWTNFAVDPVQWSKLTKGNGSVYLAGKQL